MWIFLWNPFIHNISVFICHFQMCPRKFFPCSQIWFCQFHHSWLIFTSKLIRNLCHIFTFIFKGKLLFFLCSDKSIRCFQFLHIILTINWKICKKTDLTIFIGCFLFNDLICFQKHFTRYGSDVFGSIQSKNSASQNTINIFFFLQYLHNYFLAGILPVFIKSNHRCILITIA